MEEKQFENNNFILYSPDSLNYITNDLEIILNNTLEFYKSIFNVNGFRKVQIHYFDDINIFRNYVYELRGEKDSLPEYAKGVFDNGMIIAYIEPNIIEGTPLFIKRKYLASHELFHIMYQELGWEKYNFNRVTWFDEGMAQLFSGETTFEIDENYIKDFLSHIDSNYNLNDLSHGNSFNSFGYEISLIAVKYIYDKLGIDKFKELLYNEQEIYRYGETIIQEIIDKYKSKTIK